MMSKIKELLCVSEEEIHTVRHLFNKTEEDIQEDVNLLLEWLKKQPHLPKHIDRARLERFLLRNKFRIEQTKVKLDNYYSFKIFYPDFYTYLDPKSQLMENVRKSVIVTPMPKLLPTSQRIIYLNFLQNQEEHFNFLGMMQFVLVFWEFQLCHDYSSSDVYVCNNKALSFKYVVKMDPNLIYRWFHILKNGYSGRFFQAHYVNVSPAVDVLVKTLKQILTAKLFGKIMVHKHFDSLHKVIPKEYLPEEIGGTAGSAKDIRDKWIEEMILQKEFLKRHAEETSNETLRMGKSAYSDLFGIDGTFRKINID